MVTPSSTPFGHPRWFRRAALGAALAMGLASLTAGCGGSHRAKPPAVSRPAIAAHGLAALGDSYSAGEGAGPYLDGTDVAGDECLRSNQAYGPLLDTDKRLGTLTFVACSGASTIDLLRANHEYPLEHGQIGAIPAPTKTVTLTIGGNDAGFSSVLISCISGHIGPITVFPHFLEPQAACHSNASLRQTISARLAALAAPSNSSKTTIGAAGTPIVAISTLLADIHARAPQAHIYLLGYPALFGSFSGSCHLGTIDATHVPLIGSVGVAITISAADASWINAVAGQLNASLKAGVAAVNALDVPATFVDVSAQFEGHRLCDPGSSWIAPVSGTANVKTRTAKLDPSAFHPTGVGQRDGYEAALVRAGAG